MRFFDLETLIYAFQTKLEANLNAEIYTINLQYNPGYLLPTPVISDFLLEKPSTSSYIVFNMDEKVKNYRDFVFLSIEAVGEIKQAGLRVGKTYNIETDIFIGKRHDAFDPKRTMRFWRALEDSVVKTWRKIDPALEVEVTSLSPINVEIFNSSFQHSVVGVIGQFTITN